MIAGPVQSLGVCWQHALRKAELHLERVRDELCQEGPAQERPANGLDRVRAESVGEGLNEGFYP